ncbi:MAG TPA: metallophosphoesterase [Flavobacterium sp.]|nr:metallophosphoesterase [Flavobacterium sp.]
MLRWVFFIVFFLLIEVYAFQALRAITKTKWILISYIVVSAIVDLYILYQLSQFDRKVGQTQVTLFTIGLLLICFIPKMIVSIFMLLEDVYRVLAGIYFRLTESNADSGFLPTRRSFVSKVALGIAAVPFLSLLYGMTIGKYNFRVIRQPVFFPDLPDEFDGFTITHISDIHSGSFDSPDKINYAIDLINEQNSDILLFTGDIVNTHGSEMHPWIDTFNRLKNPKFGKFSVLGNHDYGEYIDWDTEAEKQNNFASIIDLHRQIGFKLLRNENSVIRKGNDTIAIVGVENWGRNFKKAGDLKVASANLVKEDFKVLMTHDPSHWELEVKNHPKNFHLTLSGHTHGMQFGIEIPGVIKWSPAQYIYKQWAGLYENLGRYVYVNRGFGFHAYPGRVGIMPEITVLELKKTKISA